MTRIMGDSSTFGDVPNHVDIVAAYINGHFGVATKTTLEKKYPNARYGHVLIDVFGSRPDANARDWENGDKGGDLRNWVVNHNNFSGVKDAVIYANRSTIPEVRRLTGDQILNKDYFLWVATGDGDIVKGSGIVACQDKWSGLTKGHWDSSVVFDDNLWKNSTVVDHPHPSPPPVPSPPPAPAPHKPNCTAFQRAIRTTVDNLWGAGTDKNADAIIKATQEQFPYGRLFAQNVVGTRADGVWGANSKRSLRDTTAHAQRALGDMGFNPGNVDGVWGSKTITAYRAARAACHI
jgi:hypothetical protein